MFARASVVGLALLGACGSPASYAIPFSASVAGQPFSCTQTYANVGTSHATIAPLDLRFYVSSVALIEDSGTRVPLQLDDNPNQGDGIALVDLEDGTGTCATDSPATYTTLVGHGPSGSEHTLELTLGVPLAKDHLEVVAATGPLSEPAMFFSSVAGYKYLRTAVSTTVNPSWPFDLGAQTCSAASDDSLVCKYPNLATITLPSWHEGATVELDLAALFAQSDLDAMETSPGCESTDDPQCPPLFAQLGLPFLGGSTPPAQVVFGVK